MHSASCRTQKQKATAVFTLVEKMMVSKGQQDVAKQEVYYRGNAKGDKSV